MEDPVEKLLLLFFLNEIRKHTKAPTFFDILMKTALCCEAFSYDKTTEMI